VQRAAEGFIAATEGLDKKALNAQYNEVELSHALPPRMDERRFFQILAVLRLGGSKGDAADLGGISMGMFTTWFERGRELSESGWDVVTNPTHEFTGYVNFYRGCKKAVTEGKMRLNQRIWAAASRGNWKAAAWMLERKWPNEYGKRTHVTIEESTGDLVKDAMNMDPAERRRQLAELEAIQNTINIPARIDSEDAPIEVPDPEED
jgi:hypothetical protein